MRYSVILALSVLIVLCFLGCILYLYFGALHNTGCAPGFSKKCFDGVRIGQTREKVKEILGSDTGSYGITSDGYTVSAFTYPIDPEKDFVLYGIAFGNDGRVSEKIVRLEMD
jgi:hypothetical protein